MMKPARLLGIVLLAAAALAACSGGGFRPAKSPQTTAIGVPVKSLNWTRYHFGLDKTGATAIFFTAGQQGAGFFCLAINPATGRFHQYTAPDPKANYPTATCLAKSGKLYIGAAYAGHLYCYDPATEAMDDLGQIGEDAKAVSFPCAIDEDASGRLWIGSYGTADLTMYDPATKTFTRHGRLDDVEMYAYPMVNKDGIVCSRIAMVQPRIIAFDPKTGKKAVVGPVTDKEKDKFEAYKAEDGRVYIKSTLGDFRVDGFKAVPVKELPERKKQLPYREIAEAKPAGTQAEPFRKLALTMTDGTSKTLDLSYEAAGTEIFMVHQGPDGLIYGSSILPLHLFRFNPATTELVDLGKCTNAGGEAYSMANLDGKMYILSYTGATMAIYDPALPYNFGTEPGSNPRDMGRMDDVSYRPRSTLAGPLGRVYVASIPDYGLWSGPLSWYDPKTEQRKSYRDLAGEGSCYTLAWLPKDNLLAVGTTIDAGSGTLPKLKQAGLFLWDPAGEKKVWEGTLDRPVHAVNALLTLADGRILGTVTGGDKPQLFVFDPATKTFPKLVDLPEGDALDQGLVAGPDGKVYGMTRSCLYRLDPKTLAITPVLAAADEFDAVGPIVGKNIYYAKGVTLKSVNLFE